MCQREMFYSDYLEHFIPLSIMIRNNLFLARLARRDQNLSGPILEESETLIILFLEVKCKTCVTTSVQAWHEPIL
jgi:hypothetical protein